MTKILLIRHAMTDSVGKRLAGRTPGIPLNHAGIEQAAGLARRLEGLKIDEVYSSPLERALQTAEVIAKPRNLPVRESEYFLEVDFGEWTNLTIEELRNDPQFRLFNTFRSGTRIPGGELMQEAQLRIIAGIEKICSRHKEGVVAIVSHADMIRSAVAWYAGIHIDLMNRLEISPASVSIVDVHDHSSRISLLNETGYLKVQ